MITQTLQLLIFNRIMVERVILVVEFSQNLYSSIKKIQ